MNKIIVTDPHFLMAVVGPSGCGKTRLVLNLLKNHENFLKPVFDSIIYVYQHWQNQYEELLTNLSIIQFHHGVDWEKINSLPSSKRHLVVFDDVFNEIASSDHFLNLVISGRHQNLHVIFLKHNLYQKSLHAKSIDLNLTHILLLKSPRDINQIDLLGRQLGSRGLLSAAYKSATHQPYGHLLIDLDPRCPEELRFCSNLLDSESIFYLPSNSPEIVCLDDAFGESKYAESTPESKTHITATFH